MIIPFDFIFTATGFKNRFFFLISTYLKFNHPMSLIMIFFPFHTLFIYTNNSSFGMKVTNTKAKS